MTTKIRVGKDEVELPARRPDEPDATFDQVNFMLRCGLVRGEDVRSIGRSQAAHLIKYVRSTPEARAERIRIAVAVIALIFFFFLIVLGYLRLWLGGPDGG